MVRQCKFYEGWCKKEVVRSGTLFFGITLKRECIM